jgi:hypothetical protein
MPWKKLSEPLTFVPNFGPIWLQIWPPGGHLGKKTVFTYMYSWNTDWISSKFLSLVYLISMHDIIPRFFIWPTFEGHRDQSSKVHSRHVSLLVDLEYSNIVLILSRCSRHFYQISPWSDIKSCHQMVHLETYMYFCIYLHINNTHI